MPNLLTYVGTIQHLNCGGQESQKQFAVYDSDTHHLEKGQGHQNWNKLIDPKQGDPNAKFGKPCFTCFNSVRDRANHKVSVKSGNTSIIFLKYEKVKNSGIFNASSVYLKIL